MQRATKADQSQQKRMPHLHFADGVSESAADKGNQRS
jgi:hypothetical protein